MVFLFPFFSTQFVQVLYAINVAGGVQLSASQFATSSIDFSTALAIEYSSETGETYADLMVELTVEELSSVVR